MEWIVITAPSVSEAEERALDKLGVAREDAEFEIVAEATSQLFGLRKTPAQIRARVRTVAPPPKAGSEGRRRSSQRRSRNGRGRSKTKGPKPGEGSDRARKGGDGPRADGGSERQGRGKDRSAPRSGAGARRAEGKHRGSDKGPGSAGSGSATAPGSKKDGGGEAAQPAGKRRTRRVTTATVSAGAGAKAPSDRATRPSPKQEASGAAAGSASPVAERGEMSTQAAQGGKRTRTISDKLAASAAVPGQESTMTEATIEDQQAMVGEFLEGLASSFGVTATASVTASDEDSFDINLDGAKADLGLLIGPRGSHLVALHEVTKTMLQRRLPGVDRARIRVDVGGYRAARREALEAYVAELVAEVNSSGVEKGLEPMNSSDRKVVHDAVNAAEGVRTISVGEEPRRRVVIVPEGD